LDGTVPSTTSEQAASPNKLVSAGDLNLQTLGSGMGGGMDGGNKGGGGQVPAKGDGFPGGNGVTQQSSNPGMQPNQFGVPDSNGNRPAYNTGYLVLIAVLTAALLAAILITAKLKRKY
jgi:hypothetical protein